MRHHVHEGTLPPVNRLDRIAIQNRLKVVVVTAAAFAVCGGINVIVAIAGAVFAAFTAAATDVTTTATATTVAVYPLTAATRSGGSSGRGGCSGIGGGAVVRQQAA
jgi:uncharacterized membrane protein YgcG